MNKERSIIEVIQPVDPIFSDHLDSLNMGDTPWQEPASYRNIETAETYLHLAGGIGWPWKDVAASKMPGEGVDAPLFTCLEELEDARIEGLLDGCLRFRERYGFRQSDNLFQTWYGDSIRFASLNIEFNRKLMDEKTPGVYLSDPVDHHQPNYFELYKRRIQSLLTTNETGHKSLTLGKCGRLRNYLQNLPNDVENCPAITALGGVVYSLMVSTPWTVRTHLSGPTINDMADYESYATWSRDLYQNGWNGPES